MWWRTWQIPVEFEWTGKLDRNSSLDNDLTLDSPPDVTIWQILDEETFTIIWERGHHPNGHP